MICVCAYLFRISRRIWRNGRRAPCVSRYQMISVKAAQRASGGRCSAAPECGFPVFVGKALANLIHGVQHLIKGNGLTDAGKAEFCRCERVCRSGGVSALAGTFDETAYGITDKPQHIHEHCGGCVQTLLRRSSRELRRCGRSHGRGNPCLCLAASHSP